MLVASRLSIQTDLDLFRRQIDPIKDTIRQKVNAFLEECEKSGLSNDPRPRTPGEMIILDFKEQIMIF